MNRIMKIMFNAYVEGRSDVTVVVGRSIASILTYLRASPTRTAPSF